MPTVPYASGSISDLHLEHIEYIGGNNYTFQIRSKMNRRKVASNSMSFRIQSQQTGLLRNIPNSNYTVLHTCIYHDSFIMSHEVKPVTL